MAHLRILVAVCSLFLLSAASKATADDKAVVQNFYDCVTDDNGGFWLADRKRHWYERS